MGERFEDIWAEHRQAVFRFLSRMLGNPADAEEVLQLTQERVWRGLGTFQRRSTVLTWMLRIAGNEAKRWLGKRRFVALDSAPEPAAEPERPAAGWDHREVIAQALTAGLLNATEAAVMSARLNNPDLGWAEIATTVGLSPVNAAQVNVRGLSKFRVFLMVRHPDLCGSAATIAGAFERACGGVNPLTEAERQAFRAVVLDRTTRANAPGYWTDIQSACGKVSEFLSAEGSP